jgi:hypothetical protein
MKYVAIVFARILSFAPLQKTLLSSAWYQSQTGGLLCLLTHRCVSSGILSSRGLTPVGPTCFSE